METPTTTESTPAEWDALGELSVVMGKKSTTETPLSDWLTLDAAIHHLDNLP